MESRQVTKAIRVEWDDKNVTIKAGAFKDDSEMLTWSAMYPLNTAIGQNLVHQPEPEANLFAKIIYQTSMFMNDVKYQKTIYDLNIKTTRRLMQKRGKN